MAAWWWLTSLIPELGRPRQAYLCKSRTVWCTDQDSLQAIQRNPVSKNQNPKRTKKTIKTKKLKKKNKQKNNNKKKTIPTNQSNKYKMDSFPGIRSYLII